MNQHRLNSAFLNSLSISNGQNQRNTDNHLEKMKVTLYEWYTETLSFTSIYFAHTYDEYYKICRIATEDIEWTALKWSKPCKVSFCTVHHIIMIMTPHRSLWRNRYDRIDSSICQSSQKRVVSSIVNVYYVYLICIAMHTLLIVRNVTLDLVSYKLYW